MIYVFHLNPQPLKSLHPAFPDVNSIQKPPAWQGICAGVQVHKLHNLFDLGSCECDNFRRMGEYICPHCRNPVYDDEALLCHFCGESLRRGSGGVLGRLKYGAGGMVMMIVAAACLIVWILWQVL